MSESPKRRRRRGRDEWRQLLEQQARSGQTQRTFCAAHGISVTSLQNWKRRLGAGSTPEALLELGTLSGSEPSGWDIEFDLGDGVCLRLRRC